MDKNDKDELRQVIRDAANEAAGNVSSKQTITVVHATLKAMGMDVDNPLELQQDFAHLRSRRMDKENTGKAVKDASLRYGVTAALAATVSWFITHAPGGN